MFDKADFSFGAKKLDKIEYSLLDLEKHQKERPIKALFVTFFLKKSV